MCVCVCVSSNSDNGGYGSRGTRFAAPPPPRDAGFRAVGAAAARELGSVIDMEAPVRAAAAAAAARLAHSHRRLMRAWCVVQEDEESSVVNVNGVSIGVPRRMKTAGVDEARGDRATVVSRDVMIREALPVVYLRQLKVPRAGDGGGGGCGHVA